VCKIKIYEENKFVCVCVCVCVCLCVFMCVLFIYIIDRKIDIQDILMPGFLMRVLKSSKDVCMCVFVLTGELCIYIILK
jgi:hypothetical protein